MRGVSEGLSSIPGPPWHLHAPSTDPSTGEARAPSHVLQFNLWPAILSFVIFCEMCVPPPLNSSDLLRTQYVFVIIHHTESLFPALRHWSARLGLGPWSRLAF
eukprot:EG_transcript_34039